MKKFFLFIVVLVLLILLAPFWLGLIFRDSKPVDTSDLVITWESPKVNAYDSLIQLDESNYLEILDKAAEADGYLEPGLEGELSWITAVPTLTGFMDAIRASIAHAEELVENGDEEASTLELDRTLRVVQMMDNAPGTLIQSIIVYSSKELIFEAIRDNGLDMDVSEYADIESGMINAYKLEFMLAKDVIESVELGGLDIGEDFLWGGIGYYFHPNETLAEFAEITRENISIIQAGCDGKTEVSNPPYAPDFLFFTENAFGKVLIEALTPRALSDNEKICEMEILINELQ